MERCRVNNGAINKSPIQDHQFMPSQDLFTIGKITNNLTPETYDLCFSCSFNSSLTLSQNISTNPSNNDLLVDLLAIQITASHTDNMIYYFDIHLSGLKQQYTLSHIDSDPKKGRVITIAKDLEKYLNRIISIAESRIRSLQGIHKDIYEQRKDSDQPTPIITLLIDNFPLGWSNSAISLLNKILRTSHITGVVCLIKGVQENIDELEINRQRAIQIKKHNETINPATPDTLKPWFQLRLNFVDIQINKSIFYHLSEDISNSKIFKISEGIKVFVGNRFNKPYYFKLQCDEPHLVHAIVVGGTGSGKTVLLNKIITECITTYPSNSLSIYLIDLKEGVEFNIYKTSPNVCRVLDNSNIDQAIKLLDCCIQEIEDRGKLFNELSVRNIESYNEISDQQLPRILVIIDEFQKLYGSSYHSSKQLNQLLSDLARRARSFGINIIFASQSISDSKIDRQTLEQFALRVALRMAERESRYFLNIENSDAAYLEVGEAIYNSQNGQKEHNQNVQIDFLSDKSISDIINSSTNNPPSTDVLGKHINNKPLTPENKFNHKVNNDRMNFGDFEKALKSND